MKFAFGCSSKLNIFDKNIKNIFKKLEEYNFYTHISLTYPYTAFYFKFFVKKKDKIIAKILGENSNLFRDTIKKTIILFGLKKIEIVQLSNLPIINKTKSRTVSNIDLQKYNELLKLTYNYKKKKLISKIYIQLYYSDSYDFIQKILKDFEGVAITCNPNYLNITKDNFLLIKSSKKSVLLLSSFGSIDKKKLNIRNQSEWTKKCLAFPHKIFDNDIIQVGRTSKLNRIEEIKNYIVNENNLAFDIKVNFLNDNILQQNSKNYISDIKYNFKIIEFLEIIKNILRKIFYAKKN